MSFIIGKLFGKHWYIPPQSVVRRTAQLVKTVRNTHKRSNADFFNFALTYKTINKMVIFDMVFDFHNVLPRKIAVYRENGTLRCVKVR